jgi:hypothetical protein
MAPRESPRIRRLRTDLRALEALRSESTVVDFAVPSNLYGGLPESYVIKFYGKGLWKPESSEDVLLRERHEMTVTLGASYPRMQPELQWKTPIFHPNISAGGVVCLGGYQTHWVPSVNLDELCTMLWDMIRYANYDVESPYNREAAQWARTQSQFQLPLDDRPIRDRVATGRKLPDPAPFAASPVPPPEPEVVFLDSPNEPTPGPPVEPKPGQLVEISQGDADEEEIIEAEIIETEMVAGHSPSATGDDSNPFRTSSSVTPNLNLLPGSASVPGNSVDGEFGEGLFEESTSRPSDDGVANDDVTVSSGSVLESDDQDIMFIE